MHPYVYKKHHKPHQLIALVILYSIMILCQPVSSSSSSCNYPVKKIKIFSDFSKGHIRIEGNNVIAAECKHHCSEEMAKNFLYKVTIDKHYMLLYHIGSAKFICWNKTFKRLVAKRNPTNLTYCKFEDKLSKISDFKGSKIRYTTMDNNNNKEVEIRFNKSGAFARPNFIVKCARKHLLDKKMKWSAKRFLKLDPSHMEEDSSDMRAYRHLMRSCANPDFLPADVDECVTRLPDFCAEMKKLTDNGHSITFEIMELCKNEWSKFY